jgi:hypothetical protein
MKIDRTTNRSFEDANAFILLHHRHHKPVQGHRFSVSAWNGEKLCKPWPLLVGQWQDWAGHPLEVLEVTRVVF